MHFELDEEHRMLRELVAHFVDDFMMPLETITMERAAKGEGAYLTAQEQAPLNEKVAELGLWGLDAPEDVGGVDLPHVAMIGVNIELGRTITPYTLPPDSPNLKMMVATVNEDQRDRYLAPYVQNGTISAIGISEPGAGADPAGMITVAVRDGDDWVINGRKIWIQTSVSGAHVIDSRFGFRFGLTR